MKIHKSLAARFAKNLAEIQKERGLSDHALGNMLEISHMYVGYLKRGDRTPSLGMVEMIAHRLGYKDAIDMLK